MFISSAATDLNYRVRFVVQGISLLVMGVFLEVFWVQSVYVEIV